MCVCTEFDTVVRNSTFHRYGIIIILKFYTERKPIGLKYYYYGIILYA